MVTHWVWWCLLTFIHKLWIYYFNEGVHVN